jgi:hypothetical protein
MRDIILNVAEIGILMGFMETDQDVKDIAKQCNECATRGAGYRVLENHLQSMCSKRDKLALNLAKSLAITFVAVQGPQVNPVEIARETETSVF